MKRMAWEHGRGRVAARRGRARLLGCLIGVALMLTLGLAPAALGAGSSTTSVAANPTTVVTNQPVTLTATVTPNGGTPTGTVNFSTPRGPISGCTTQPVTDSGGTYTATCTTTLSPSDSPFTGSGVQVSATYGPSSSPDDVGTSMGSQAVPVNAAATTTALSVPTTSTPTAQPVTITATVAQSSVGAGYGTEQPNGTVEFLDGTSQLYCGAASLNGADPDTTTCTAYFYTAGSHAITAQYQPATYPAADFAGSTSSPAQTVTVTAPTPPTRTTGTTPKPTPKPKPTPTPRPKPKSGGIGSTIVPPCTELSPTRNVANPLGLSSSPGPNPLHGAPFFVDGPAHGNAAGEIARLLGIDRSVPIGHYLPAFPDSESWKQFLSTTVARKLPSEPLAVRKEVALLEKMAVEPEAQRISVYSEGGSPGGIAAFTNKLLCHNLTADPGSIPVITTYFMHPALGGCSTSAQINAYMPLFRRRIDAIVQATGRRPVVYLLELDGTGSTSCMAQHGSLGAWERMLRYEVDDMATLPHAVVYVEGGYSDSNTPRYAANLLNRVDIRRIRGFFTNDTHMNWTTDEIKYGDAISRMTHGAHFIVNTAENGRGPLLNPHPTTQGIENLCNPPGRALGPLPTTTTGYPKVDALLWTFPPGNSSGSCNGGPPSGVWWPARAIQLAAAANGRLGPGSPSRPY